MITRQDIQKMMKFCPGDKDRMLKLFLKHKNSMSDYCFSYYIKKLYPMNLSDIHNNLSITKYMIIELFNFKQFDFIIDSLKNGFLDSKYLVILLNYILTHEEYELYPRVFNSLYFLIRDSIEDKTLIEILDAIIYSATTRELQNCCITIYELLYGTDYNFIIIILASNYYYNSNIQDLCYNILKYNNITEIRPLINLLFNIDRDMVVSLFDDIYHYDDLYNSLYLESIKMMNNTVIQDLFAEKNTIEFTNFLLG